MGAYIVHFDDKPWEDLDDELYYRCFEIPWFSTTKTTISRLTPYTEDSAYAHGFTEAESKYREIRDELEKQAYQRGYKEAYDTAYADAEEIYESGKRAMYQKGLKDAWECARKIVLPGDVSGIYLADLEEIFDRSSLQDVIKDYSASECIEKIRAYKQEKEEQIQVGDEVIPRETEYDDMIVTRLWKDDYDSDCIDAIGFDGRIGSFLVSRVSKTGKHYEIAEVLQKMKETDNG
jgi:hypothetical protein